MAEIAQELDADIHLSEAVTGFEFDGKRPRAVLTDKGRYECDAVVINADFAEAMRQLVPDSLRRRWTDKKIATKRFSCSTFMLYLGVRGSYPDLPHHTIHITADYERNLRQIEQDFTLPDKPSFYVQNACVTDDSLAPAGHSTLYVLVPVPHGNENVTWDEPTCKRYRELALDQLALEGLRRCAGAYRDRTHDHSANLVR